MRKVCLQQVILESTEPFRCQVFELYRLSFWIIAEIPQALGVVILCRLLPADCFHIIIQGNLAPCGVGKLEVGAHQLHLPFHPAHLGQSVKLPVHPRSCLFQVQALIVPRSVVRYRQIVDVLDNLYPYSHVPSLSYSYHIAITLLLVFGKKQ